MEEIIKYLEIETSIFNTGHNNFAYRSIGEFILKNGICYSQISKKKYPKGATKQCFRNAYKLAERDDGLTYVEGYALTSNIPIPLMHAWVVDKDGAVIDNTWRPVGVEYFGVPFDIQYVNKIIFEREKYGVIDCWEIGWPLLTGKHIYKGNGKITIK